MVVEPCGACARFVRRGAAQCPFCQAKRVTQPAPRRALGRTRLALAGGAALLLAACGDPETPPDESAGSGGEAVHTDDGTGGDVADGPGGDSDVAHGEVGGGGEMHEEEMSCAGVCGSHHHPPCMDDPDPCPAPPYGAPPVADPLV